MKYPVSFALILLFSVSLCAQNGPARYLRQLYHSDTLDRTFADYLEREYWVSIVPNVKIPDTTLMINGQRIDLDLHSTTRSILIGKDTMKLEYLMHQQNQKITTTYIYGNMGKVFSVHVDNRDSANRVIQDDWSTNEYNQTGLLSRSFYNDKEMLAVWYRPDGYLDSAVLNMGVSKTVVWTQRSGDTIHYDLRTISIETDDTPGGQVKKYPFTQIIGDTTHTFWCYTEDKQTKTLVLKTVQVTDKKYNPISSVSYSDGVVYWSSTHKYDRNGRLVEYTEGPIRTIIENNAKGHPIRKISSKIDESDKNCQVTSVTLIEIR